MIEIERVNDERLLRMAVSLTKEREPFAWVGLGEGFGMRLVDELIERCPRTPTRILDPFAGSGTTLWGAARRNIPALGLEVMPMCQRRYEWLYSWNDLDLELVASLADEMLALTNERAVMPHHDLGLLKDDLKMAVVWRDFLQRVSSRPEQGLLQAVSLMALRDRQRSFASFRWHGKRVGRKGKLGQVPRHEDLRSSFRLKMTKALLHYTVCQQDERMMEQEMETASALRRLPSLSSSSFDCIITSPPYYNGFDYLENYRLEHWFLGMEEDLREAGKDIFPTGPGNGIGAAEVRQAYREGGGSLLADADGLLARNGLDLGTIEEYYEAEEAEPFHGHMLAEALTLAELARVVSKGGSIFYVIDDAYVGDDVIPLGEVLSVMATDLGLETKAIYRDLSEKEELGRLAFERQRTAVCHWVR